MAKQLQLTIPTPCHENWDAMTTVDKGKFCGSCQKNVVDFSNMSDRQVALFFKKPSTGSVCGRFMNDQLDRDIEIPKKRIPWVKYFFQFALPAFLLSIKSSSAKAQGNVTVKQINKPTKHIVGEPMLAKCSKSLIGDTLIMPEVVVTTVIKPQVPGQVTDLVTALKGKVAGPVVMVVNKPADISNGRDLSKPTQVNVLHSLVGTVGMVSVRKEISKTITKSAIKKDLKQVPLMPATSTDPAVLIFKVFPNPVSSGANLNIELKKTEEGYYTLELLNQSGQSVHMQEIWIDAEARLLNIDLPSFAAGIYFLVLTNKKSERKVTEKIIIQ
jgi:Secretion system C-terminal sorting domain